MYTFYLIRHSNCSGIPINYQNEQLVVSGNPLPRNASNASINSIVMRPDSNRFILSNNGITHPICSQGNTVIDCNNGGFRRHFYKSDPIQLNGVPPSSGWKFICNSGDFRSYVNAGGQSILISTLYPDSAMSNASTCYEQSPRFAEFPQFQYCSSVLNEGSITAIDQDGDSLVYELVSLLTSSGGNYVSANYNNGYSATSPLPSLAFNSSNIPLNYDSKTGEISFKSVQTGSYGVNFQVSAYRNGLKISEVRHEAPIVIITCPDLPNQVQNSAPTINPPFHKGGGIYTYSDSVVAGNPINIGLQVRDTNTYNGNGQNLRIEVFGPALAVDMRTPSNCLYPNDTSCAVLLSNPQYDTSRQTYYYTALSTWSSLVSWQTDCNHLKPDGSAKTHYFYVKAQDDLCPIPGRNTEVISITVLPDPNLCPMVATSLSSSSEFKSNFSIYPNPSSGLVNIDRSETEELQLEIFDLQGRKVNSRVLLPSEPSIQLPEESGIYFLRLTDQKGNQGNFKVIKK